MRDTEEERLRGDEGGGGGGGNNMNGWLQLRCNKGLLDVKCAEKGSAEPLGLNIRWLAARLQQSPRHM